MTQPFTVKLGEKLTVQKVDVWQKRVVYKLHAGWFINRTLGECIISGLFI